MVKAKSNSIAVAPTATLAGRAMARLEAAARTVHASETEKRDRELQLVSTADHGFSAVIRHGKTIVEISGNDFAVRQTG
jgi:hypothetical protein